MAKPNDDLNVAIRDAAEDAKTRLSDLLLAAADSTNTTVRASVLIDLHSVTKKLAALCKKLAQPIKK